MGITIVGITIPGTTVARPIALAFLAVTVPCLGGETVLVEFPVVVRAGLSAKPPDKPSEKPSEKSSEKSSPDDLSSKVLPDLPFNPEQGYGYVGGRPDRLVEAVTLGGDPAWPVAWREGMEKYLFRLPAGEYLLEMSFVETDVALPGLRVFDVLAEDARLFSRVDVCERAGDFVWLTLRGLVSVYDGWLDIRFLPAGGRPPRVSRIEILKAEGLAAQSGPPRPTLACRGSAGRNLLKWSLPAAAGIIGYGVFRAESVAGAFEPLTREPVSAPFFADWAAAPGQELFYKVCAYDVWGRQGQFSDPVKVASRSVGDLGLKAYDLTVSADDLKTLSSRAGAAPEVPAELRFLGAVYYVNLRAATDRASWQRKKSYHVALQQDRNRSFQRRSAFFLSAEAADPTFLREKLSADAAARLGLASPAVEPVALTLNGRFEGVYLDMEPLDRRFRARCGLDRVGLLAEVTRGDVARCDWLPCGDQVDEEGNIMSLTEFVHELNRVEEGESTAYLERRLYLDRFIDRAALCAIRGEVDRPSALRFALKDSRNGKWEFFQDRHRSGDWGIFDFSGKSRPVSEEDARRMLLGRSLDIVLPGGGEISILETRFFRQEGLRKKFLSRVEALLSGELGPEKFDALVDGAFSTVGRLAQEDESFWLSGESEASFLSGPARIKADHRVRAAALREAMARAASRPAAALVVNEVLLEPLEGEPWIEFRNVSQGSIDLAEYWLTGSWALDKAPRGSSLAKDAVRLEPRVLQPGEAHAALLGSLLPRGPRLLSETRFLALFRRGQGPPELCDFVSIGAQTRGISYGRLPAGPAEPGTWAYLAEPSQGRPGGGATRKPPSYEFRQGVTRLDSGALSITLRASAHAAQERPARVLLKLQEDGSDTFKDREMSWDDRSFQFTETVEAPGKRTAYYFVAVSPDGAERAYPLLAPGVTYALPVLPAVKINEVLPRPLREDRAPESSLEGPSEKGPSRQESSPGEFIEIYNASDQEVDLEGFFLSDSRRNPTKWRIPAGNRVKPKGFLVFLADGTNRGNHTSFKLSNSGEFLGIFGRMEEGNLVVDSTAFRGVRSGESWGASPDGSKSFRAWKDPTPGARNIPKIPEEFLKKKLQEGKAEEQKAAKD